ncbi:hypothetical protein EV368DRAFT_83744 [Lentinula lateritia]|nr:hypothetical protein EV368DRAFT_83744 [Lentinula lateritia]
MGTRGFHVYRYKGFYYVFFNQYDSYPEGLGVQVANEIPSDPTEFESYVASTQKYLLRLFSESKEKDDGSDPEIRKTPPQNDIFIEWMYEIDLDNYIFHVDGEPLFDIRNMPRIEDFTSYIGTNSYGCRSFTVNTPEEHRYKLPPPLPIATEVDDIYKGLHSTCTATHEVLHLPPGLRGIEQIRFKFMQVFIASSMRTLRNSNGLGINAVLSDEVSNDVVTRLRVVVDTLSGPLVFSNSIASVDPKPLDTSPFQWVVKDVLCMLAVPRLDQVLLVQGAIVHLMQHIESHFQIEAYAVGTMFHAAILSLYHVSIVCFKVIEHDGRKALELTHTHPLRFLPTEHPTSSSTPGLKALSRLGQVVFEKNLRQDVLDRNYVCHRLASGSIIELLPTEICISIAQYLPRTALKPLATISPTWAHVAFEFLLHPWIERSRSIERSINYDYDWYYVVSHDLPSTIAFETVHSSLFLATGQDGRKVAVVLTSNFKSDKYDIHQTFDISLEEIADSVFNIGYVSDLWRRISVLAFPLSR